MPIRRRRNLGDIVLSKTLTLTDAQIKAQNSGAFGIFEVVPAPGSGKVLVFSQAIIRVDNTAGAYTNIGVNVAANISYDADPISGNVLHIALIGTAITTALLNGVADPKMIAFAPIASSFTDIFQSGPLSNFENKNLGFVLSNLPGLADFTGGNSANSAKVTIFYDVLTL